VEIKNSSSERRKNVRRSAAALFSLKGKHYPFGVNFTQGTIQPI
jgi:hypothetical protein